MSLEGATVATPRLPFYAGAFVLALDAGSAGHLLPGLQAATGVGAREASWFVTGFMLAMLFGAPLQGLLAGRFGRARVLAASLLLFAIGGVLVGLTTRFELAVAGRAAQGFAGAGIMALGAAHLADTAAPGRAGHSVSLLSFAYWGGFVSGIVFASLWLLVSFRLAYLFTAVLALVAAISLARVPETRPERVRTRSVQNGGSVLTIGLWALTLGCAAIAVTNVDRSGRGSSTPVLIAQLLAVPALLVFLWTDGRFGAALLPSGLFRSRHGLALTGLALCAGLGQAAIIMLPSVAIGWLGVPPAASGPLMVPVLAGGLGTSVLASARLDRWGAWPFLVGGAGAIILGGAVIASAGRAFLAFEAGALLFGTGVGLLSSGALRIFAQAEARSAEADLRQAAVSLLTNVGLMLGAALWGASVGGAAFAHDPLRAGLVALTVASVPLGALVFLAPPSPALVPLERA
jgi:MFS family permease